MPGVRKMIPHHRGEKKITIYSDYQTMAKRLTLRFIISITFYFTYITLSIIVLFHICLQVNASEIIMNTKHMQPLRLRYLSSIIFLNGLFHKSFSGQWREFGVGYGGGGGRGEPFFKIISSAVTFKLLL